MIIIIIISTGASPAAPAAASVPAAHNRGEHLEGQLALGVEQLYMEAGPEMQQLSIESG